MAATLPALTHQLQPIIALATDAVTSPHTHRAYSRALAGFLVWMEQARPAGLTKATVQAYIAQLKAQGTPASSLNQRLTAIRKLSVGVRPHDLRHTFAKLAHKGGSPIDPIQLSLGHSSIQTTERYVGVDQDLTSAPCDILGLRLEPSGPSAGMVCVSCRIWSLVDVYGYLGEATMRNLTYTRRALLE